MYTQYLIIICFIEFANAIRKQSDIFKIPIQVADEIASS